MKLTDLSKYITTRLENLTGWSVYNKIVPDTALYPYIVYNLGHGDSEERSRITRNLEIDYYIDSTDNSDLLDMSEVVRRGKYVNDVLTVYGLDYSYQSENEGFYHCFHDWEDEIDTGETYISRFQQRYVLHVYDS